MALPKGLTTRKHPFVELFMYTAFMVTTPAFLIWFFTIVMKEYTKYSDELIYCQAVALTGMIMISFVGIMVLLDVYTEHFMIVINRIKEFISSARSGLWRTAFHYYWEDIKENGINLLLYLVFVTNNVLMVVYGIQQFIQIIKI